VKKNSDHKISYMLKNVWFGREWC